MLRKLRTEKAAEVKQFRLELDHLKTHKDTSAKLRRECDEGAARHAELKATIERLDADMLTPHNVRSTWAHRQWLQLSSCQLRDTGRNIASVCPSDAFPALVLEYIWERNALASPWELVADQHAEHPMLLRRAKKR